MVAPFREVKIKEQCSNSPVKHSAAMQINSSATTNTLSGVTAVYSMHSHITHIHTCMSTWVNMGKAMQESACNKNALYTGKCTPMPALCVSRPLSLLLGVQHSVHCITIKLRSESTLPISTQCQHRELHQSTHMHRHTLPCTQPDIDTHTCMQTHACTLHTHTHTHTHTLSCTQPDRHTDTHL